MCMRRTSTKRRRVFAIIGVVAVGVIAFVLLYFEPQTAFIDDKVSETIPGLEVVEAAAPASTSTPTSTTAATTVAPVAPSASVPADATPASGEPATTIPATSTPPVSSPPTPTSSSTNSLAGALAAAQDTGLPVVISTGTFFSGEHDTSGTALVVALPDGSLVVRFEGLDTSNGPDLRVVLSTDEASDAWDYAGRHIVDELKGNIGDQNYAIPADVDLSKFHSVVIWCERFSVAFGAAPITVVA
jgi:Electron transfer DM13